MKITPKRAAVVFVAAAALTVLSGCTALAVQPESDGAVRADVESSALDAGTTNEPSPEATPVQPEPPADYPPEAFIEKCLNRVDAYLDFWGEGMEEMFGGDLHVRARDVDVVYVGGENGFFAEIPNAATPAAPVFCWTEATVDLGPMSVGVYPNREKGIWLRLRGDNYYEIDVDTQASSRVSQEPDTSWSEE